MHPLHSAILWVSHFFPFFLFYNVEQVPIHSQLLLGMLQHCFAVKLQKSFVKSETFPDFPSAWRRVDYVRIFSQFLANYMLHWF